MVPEYPRSKAFFLEGSPGFPGLAEADSGLRLRLLSPLLISFPGNCFFFASTSCAILSCFDNFSTGLCLMVPTVTCLACDAFARAKISAYDPFFGAAADGAVAAVLVTGFWAGFAAVGDAADPAVVGFTGMSLLLFGAPGALPFAVPRYGSGLAEEDDCFVAEVPVATARGAVLVRSDVFSPSLRSAFEANGVKSFSALRLTACPLVAPPVVTNVLSCAGLAGRAPGGCAVDAAVGGAGEPPLMDESMELRNWAPC